MEPLIHRTVEVQENEDDNQIINLADLSNNEMDLEATFPSQV